MKKNILYVIGDLDVGGAEQHLVQVLPQLAKQGFNLTVYTLTHKGQLAPIMEAAGIEVVEPLFSSAIRSLPVVIRRPLIFLSSGIAYLSLLLRLRPSIIHFFLPAAYLMGGLLSLPFQCIRVMSRRSLNHYQRKHPVLAKVEHWLHQRMDVVLGNSKAVIHDLQQEGVPNECLGLLYNGIDLTAFELLPAPAVVRKNLGISEQVLLLVCVANLIPYKGHVDLIYALGKIRNTLPEEWYIAMVGRDAGIGSELRALADSEGLNKHVLWLGERRDALALYRAADIGVLCSHEEGFSNSILEGMAAESAMVVTDVGGNAEAVLDGECGIVVPSHNPEKLAKAISYLVAHEELSLKMATEARKRIIKHFSLEGCVEKYNNLYLALLKRQKGTVQSFLLCNKDQG